MNYLFLQPEKLIFSKRSFFSSNIIYFITPKEHFNLGSFSMNLAVAASQKPFTFPAPQFSDIGNLTGFVIAFYQFVRNFTGSKLLISALSFILTATVCFIGDPLYVFKRKNSKLVELLFFFLL